MLSEAMKFLVDPRPWKAADGGSFGPLNSYLISVFLLMGFKPGFVLVHMVATVLVCLQVLVAYLTLRRLGSEKTATLGACLLAFIYGAYTNRLYLHYNTELLPTLLLMTGFYAFVALLEGPGERRPRVQLSLLFLGGLALGAAPWCKLQAAPITGALGLLLLAAIFRTRDPSVSSSRRAVEVAALGCGAVLTAFVMLAILAKSGAIEDFWYSYILNNIAYAGSLSLANSLGNFLLLVFFTPVHLLLLVAILGLGLLDYVSLDGETSLLFKRHRWAFGGLLIYAGAALFAACRVKYFWPKDMFFLPPMTYVAALLASFGVSALMQSRQSRKTSGETLLLLLGLVLLGAIVALFIGYGIRYGKMVQNIHELSHAQLESAGRDANLAPQLQVTETNDKTLRDRLADCIGPAKWVLPDYGNERIVAVIGDIQKTRPVRSLAIWGWAPGVYVLTGMPPATRDAVPFFAIDRKHPYQKYFQARFLGDLRENPPDLFIDTVVRGAIMWPWKWTENDGYESDPQLRKFIEDNYILVDELTLVKGAKPIRFFARRGSASQLQ
jgi:hypothetical protein